MSIFCLTRAIPPTPFSATSSASISRSPVSRTTFIRALKRQSNISSRDKNLPHIGRELHGLAFQQHGRVRGEKTRGEYPQVTRYCRPCDRSRLTTWPRDG